MATYQREVIEFPYCEEVSKYEKIIKIGQGTFGEVFKARHQKTRKIVALKKVLMENEKEGRHEDCEHSAHQRRPVETRRLWARQGVQFSKARPAQQVHQQGGDTLVQAARVAVRGEELHPGDRRLGRRLYNGRDVDEKSNHARQHGTTSIDSDHAPLRIHHPEVWQDVDQLELYQSLELPKGQKRKVKDRLKSYVKDQYALDLIDKLLGLDPKTRTSTDEALNHDFFWEDPMPCSLTRMLSQHTQSMYEYLAPRRRIQQNHPPSHPAPPPPRQNAATSKLGLNTASFEKTY
ncbi:cyclin-dependent kinase [Apostichopus japonicus]|uniref:Cyclin-dependent kinase n=1 Tax=Stichopus japonicus TaxID=307972 RepID=A0A2G8KCS3_STIJA|nr:cyclin-dependent kinase [Apostichopus japonicus]